MNVSRLFHTYNLISANSFFTSLNCDSDLTSNRSLVFPFFNWIKYIFLLNETRSLIPTISSTGILSVPIFLNDFSNHL
jgi:hypothetical protein